jgi:DNA invertase Pin-like site-specific DNA recombinase
VREIAAGDVLVVVRLDRLARSVGHLLEVIERLEENIDARYATEGTADMIKNSLDSYDKKTLPKRVPGLVNRGRQKGIIR